MRALRHPSAWSCLLAVAAWALVHCDTYDASLLDPDPSRPAEVGGVGFWSGSGDRGCYSAGQPLAGYRPTPSEDVTAAPPILLAVSSLRLGSRDEEGSPDAQAWKSIGFDLDGRCTGSESCPGIDSPPPCRPPVSEIATDGLACRDNTFGRLQYVMSLVPDVAKKYRLDEDAFNCALCVGQTNFLIRISSYNGTPSDDDVRVDFYPSPGVESASPWTCADGDWRSHPCFNADARFTVQSEPLLGEHSVAGDLADSFISDAHAYVREGVLVAQIPQNTQLWFPSNGDGFSSFPVRFQEATVSGRLELGSDNVWRLNDGVIGGWSRGDDILQGFRLIGLCEDDDQTSYELVSDFVRRNLDLLTSGRVDRDKTCDAMSVGLAFRARQATAGKVVKVAPLEECSVPAPPDASAEAKSDAGKAGSR